MLIRYTGDAGARHLRDWHWTRENGYTVDVPDRTEALELLTLRDFAVAPTDPLGQICGPAVAAELALLGIATLPELADLTREQAAEFAERLRVPRPQIGEWALAAHRALGRDAIAETSPARRRRATKEH